MGYYKDVTCPRCGGAKFLDVEYSSEYGRWYLAKHGEWPQECCPECKGFGVVSEWTEDDHWWSFVSWNNSTFDVI